MFWNPEDKQIPKLSLGNKFDKDMRQQTGKQGVHFLLTSTVCSRNYIGQELIIVYTIFNFPIYHFIKNKVLRPFGRKAIFDCIVMWW